VLQEVLLRQQKADELSADVVLDATVVLKEDVNCIFTLYTNEHLKQLIIINI
jgi:hypothetical protein